MRDADLFGLEELGAVDIRCADFIDAIWLCSSPCAERIESSSVCLAATRLRHSECLSAAVFSDVSSWFIRRVCASCCRRIVLRGKLVSVLQTQWSNSFREECTPVAFSKLRLHFLGALLEVGAHVANTLETRQQAIVKD